MFRLLYQYTTSSKPDWEDSDNLEMLRQKRLDILQFSDEKKVGFEVEPFIKYVGGDGWIRTSSGMFFHLPVK